MAEIFFWTKSESSRLRCKSSSYEFCKTGHSLQSVLTKRFKSMYVSLRLQIGALKILLLKESLGRISFTESIRSLCEQHHFGSARKTLSFWLKSLRQNIFQVFPSPRMQANRLKTIHGPGTFVSLKTPLNEPACSFVVRE